MRVPHLAPVWHGLTSPPASVDANRVGAQAAAQVAAIPRLAVPPTSFPIERDHCRRVQRQDFLPLRNRWCCPLGLLATTHLRGRLRRVPFVLYFWSRFVSCAHIHIMPPLKASLLTGVAHTCSSICLGSTAAVPVRGAEARHGGGVLLSTSCGALLPVRLTPFLCSRKSPHRYHASSLENFHSILWNGLDTKYSKQGLFGEGAASLEC